ncbi:MAG: TonB-dependent receptor [Verrucomicrobiota bacterium]|nr:TonB-dependent receptor [Verrucomicrobiota bacterium]
MKIIIPKKIKQMIGKNVVIGSMMAGLCVLGQTGLAQSEEDAGELPPVMIISEAPQTDSRSVTLLSGDTITLGGIQEVRDIQTALPNFTVFDANNTRMPKFSVRGLRENSFGIGQSAVGMYVDGVPYADVMTRGLSLYDIDHIEFLRGPQGTQFGASAAPGGIISVRTRQPGAEWVGSGGLGYGEHSTQEYRLNASGPLNDQIGLSLSGLYNDRGGFVTNLPTGQEIDGRKTFAGRLQLVLTPSEPWTIRLTVSSESHDDGFTPTYSPLTDAGPHKVNRDVPGYVDTEVNTYALSADFSGENLSFSSVTAFRNWEQDLQQDFDFTAIPQPIAEIGFIPVIGVSQPDVEQVSQEIRLGSGDANESYQWTLGAYYADREMDNVSGSLYPAGLFHPQYGFLPGPVPDYTTSTLSDEDTALYWQSSYSLGSGLTLTGGLRYQNSDRSINRSNSSSTVNRSNDWDDVLPKLGASYSLSDKDTLYVSIAKGFQSGGFNFYGGTPESAQYDSAESWNYELGWSSSSNDGRVHTRVAAFYSDFEEYQVYRLNPVNPTEAYMVNAEEATSYGLEIEAEAQVSEILTLSAAVGLVNAEFDSYTDNVLRGVLGPMAAGYEFGGNDINFVPEYTANLAAHISLPWNLSMLWEVQGIGDYWLDEANTAEQDAYALVNGRISYKRDNWELFVYARNLADEGYSNNALDLRYTDFSNPAAPRPAGMILHIPGWPRTFGAGLRASF